MNEKAGIGSILLGIVPFLPRFAGDFTGEKYDQDIVPEIRIKRIPDDGHVTLALQGLRSKNSTDIISKESSLMRRFFPRHYGAPVAIPLYYQDLPSR